MMGILSQKYYINYFLFLIVISSTIVFCEAIDDNIYDNDENSRSAAVDFSTNCIRGPVASMTPPITQNFIMKIGATIEQRNARDVYIKGFGNMTLLFQPTANPDKLNVKLTDIRLEIYPFNLPLPPGSPQKIIRSNRIALDGSNFDIKAFNGTLDRRTKKVALKFVIILDPDKIPEMKALGIREPLKAIAIEEGTMDIEKGLIATYSEPFNLGSGPQYITVSGDQFSSCKPAFSDCSSDPLSCCSGSCVFGICDCIEVGERIPSGSSEDVCCSGDAKANLCCAKDGMETDESYNCCEGLTYSRRSGRCLTPTDACIEDGCQWTRSSCSCEERDCLRNPYCVWTGRDCYCEDMPETG